MHFCMYVNYFVYVSSDYHSEISSNLLVNSTSLHPVNDKYFWMRFCVVMSSQIVYMFFSFLLLSMLHFRISYLKAIYNFCLLWIIRITNSQKKNNKNNSEFINKDYQFWFSVNALMAIFQLGIFCFSLLFLLIFASLRLPGFVCKFHLNLYQFHLSKFQFILIPFQQLFAFIEFFSSSDTQTILTIQNNTITKNHRIGITHTENRIWQLRIRDVKESDQGWYMVNKEEKVT